MGSSSSQIVRDMAHAARDRAVAGGGDQWEMHGGLLCVLASLMVSLEELRLEVKETRLAMREIAERKV